ELASFFIVQAPYTAAASRLMFSENTSLRDVLVPSVRALGRSLLLLLLVAPVIFLCALSVVLLPMAIGRTLYRREILLLEGTPIAASLARGHRFTKGRGMHAAEVVVALVVLTCVVVAVVYLLAMSIVHDALGLRALGDLS